MKRSVLLAILLVALTIGTKAQVTDAFQNIQPVTDPAMMKSLNGIWQLKVKEGIDEEEMALPVPDDTYGEIPVPGCWEAYHFSMPSYDKAYPLTGYYHTSFTVPTPWKGHQIILRFDGVLYGYDLFINGKHAGNWRSAYNTALFDITPYLDKKSDRQQLDLRVITQFAGSDFDYNDDWAPCGIFRDVTLMAVPHTHLADLTIHTQNTGEVTIKADIANKRKDISLHHEILDAQGQCVAQGDDERLYVQTPYLWTAETPYLYTLRTTLYQKRKPLQTFNHKFGFRELTIDGNVLKLNGRPIKLRGVTCHSTDPRTVKVIDEASILKDMRLMKEASVNYIRTSHYPREPRFYDLADSLGFYVIDEVPFGFGDKNLYKEEFYPILQQRAQATIRRDKNHPSVLIWSLGNENPLTDICVQLGDYVSQELDNVRPYCYPQVGSYFRRFFENPSSNAKYSKPTAPIYAPHYPTTGQIGGFYQHLDRPVIFTEYCHSLGVSFEDHDRQWEIIERTPGIAGGSVWEWVDQGMPFGYGEPREQKDFYGYEERVYTASPQGENAPLGFEMFGNKGTDGLLYADRTPLPNYYELQHNYAQACATDSILTTNSKELTLHIRNRFDFLNLKDNVTFRWAYTEDRDTIARGAFSPDCQPRQTTDYGLQLPDIPHAQRICLLNLELSDSKGRIFNRQTIPVNPHDNTQRLLAGLTITTDNPMTLVQDGLLVRAGRKATLAETLKVGDKRLERYLLPLSSDGTTAGNIKTQIQTTKEGNATHITFSLTPDTTDTFLSELGIALLLDKRVDRAQWIGNGLVSTYPGRYRAGRYNFWALQQGDIYFEGNRRGVDAVWLSDTHGDGILMVSHNANISFEQTDRGIVLTCNAAVSGMGPKFARTAFPVIAKNTGTVTGDFYLYKTSANHLPQLLKELFQNPASVPAPCHPFQTQYDTYLMRYEDIIAR